MKTDAETDQAPLSPQRKRSPPIGSISYRYVAKA
ncbi:hypothetical protein L327_0121380 [Yersinia pestis S3]|nr:hypothetical protein L327_0121380 [Yersinia pestis S3]